MRWAWVLMVLALMCAALIVIRGAVVRDGLSLLALALATASLLAALLSRGVERRSGR